MEITLDLPEDLAARLQPLEDHLPQILELGLREFGGASQPGFENMAEVIEVLAGLPTPEEVLALRPSAALQDRIQVLLTKNRAEGLSPDEAQAWGQYELLEHLVRVAKAKAALKLQSA